MRLDTLQYQEATADLVSLGREVFKSRFPTQSFDAPVWDLRFMELAAPTARNPNAYFTTADLTAPLPSGFAAPLKAHLVLHIQSKPTFLNKLSSARAFWNSLQARGSAVVDSFAWWKLRANDLLAFEDYLAARYKPRTIYLYRMSLVNVTSALAKRNVMPEISVRFRLRKEQLDASGDPLWVSDTDPRMPSTRNVNAIPFIWAHAREPIDKLIAGALMLMLATGLRIGEVLTLSRDCVRRDNSGEESRIGILYSAEKNESASQEVRWLAGIQREIVEEVIAGLLELTSAAAARAAELEAGDGLFSVPGISSDSERLSASEVRRILDTKYWPSGLGVEPAGTDERGRRFYDGAVIRRWIASRFKQQVEKAGRGQRQALSRSLFVIFDGEQTLRIGSPKRYLVRWLTYNNVRVQLGPLTTEHPITKVKTTRPSIFARYGFYPVGADDIPNFNTHQLRHWISTTAERGGADQSLLALWLRRTDLTNADEYSHLTTAERLSRVRELFERGAGVGSPISVYKALSEQDSDLQEDYLELTTKAAHVTPLGICVQDFAVEPCRYHLNCLSGPAGTGCNHYVHDPRDPHQVAHLNALLEQYEADARRIQELQDEGVVVAEGWIRKTDSTLANIKRVLSQSNERHPFSGSSNFIKLEEIDDWTEEG